MRERLQKGIHSRKPTFLNTYSQLFSRLKLKPMYLHSGLQTQIQHRSYTTTREIQPKAEQVTLLSQETCDDDDVELHVLGCRLT